MTVRYWIFRVHIYIYVYDTCVQVYTVAEKHQREIEYDLY